MRSRTPYRAAPLLAALVVILLAGCAGQAAPTITPAPTLDTTALADSIRAQVFATLTAEPTDTPQPSPTASPSPSPTSRALQMTLEAFAARLDAQAAQAAEFQSGLAGTLTALIPASPTSAPTLDMDVLVGTVQVAVFETLVAQAQGTQNAAVTQQAAAQATQTARENQPADIGPDDDPALGPEDAAVVIISFSDFTCPHCANFAINTLPLLLERYGDRVRFVFRDAPILGPNSGWAALAAQCANDQGQFWAYHDLLFANQNMLSRDLLTAFAVQLEMNVQAFDTCVDEQTHLDEIRNDFAAAQSAGLTGTPTFFINGRRVVGAQPFEIFAAVIEEELLKAGEPLPAGEVTAEPTPET
ncbi:MAG: DsbA family protein [Chloroflexi bacterium]|nr:DsbA family protein [Chloroflexota bacterium]MDL1886094.1 DsbA family protein [Anaerolineae bacterium CFX8]